MRKAISIENLNKTYKEFQLKNVSFTVPKGSIVGFIGENGAGKTTTIKAILNLIKRDSGFIELLGKDNLKEEKEIKESLGVVLDGSNFHDHLKVSDISKMMKTIYKNWQAEVFENYLKKFDIAKKKLIKELSKGMKTKLQIAVALSHKAKLLILDEATAGLDPVVREEILDVFMEFIQDEDCAVLLSSHITSDLDKIADYIVLIHEGEIIFEEEKDSLLDTLGLVKCCEDDFRKLESYLRYRKNSFGFEVLIKDKAETKKKHPDWIVDSVSIEEIMLFYIKGRL